MPVGHLGRAAQEFCLEAVIPGASVKGERHVLRQGFAEHVPAGHLDGTGIDLRRGAGRLQNSERQRVGSGRKGIFIDDKKVHMRLVSHVLDLLPGLYRYVKRPGVVREQPGVAFQVAQLVHDAGMVVRLHAFPPVAVVAHADIFNDAAMKVIRNVTAGKREGVQRGIIGLKALGRNIISKAVVPVEIVISVPPSGICRVGIVVMKLLQPGQCCNGRLFSQKGELIGARCVPDIRRGVHVAGLGIRSRIIGIVLVGEAVVVLSQGVVHDHMELVVAGGTVAHEPRAVGDRPARIERMRVLHVLFCFVDRIVVRFVLHIVVNERRMASVPLDHAEYFFPGLEPSGVRLAARAGIPCGRAAAFIVVALVAADFLVIQQSLFVCEIEDYRLSDAPVEIEHVKAQFLRIVDLRRRDRRGRIHAVCWEKSPTDRRQYENAPVVEPEHGIGGLAGAADMIGDLKPPEPEPLHEPVLVRACSILENGLDKVEISLADVPHLCGRHGDRLRDHRTRARGKAQVAYRRGIHRDRRRVVCHDVQGH